MNFFTKPSISRYQPPDWQLLLASKGLATPSSSSTHAHTLALTIPFSSTLNNNTIINVASDNHHTLTTTTTSYYYSSLYLSEEECMSIKLQPSNKAHDTSLSSYQLKDDELVYKLLNLNWKLSTNRDLPLLTTSTSSASHNDRALVAQKHAALRLVSSWSLGGKDGVGRLVLMAFLGSLVSVLLEVMYILPVTELTRPQRVITDLSLSWHSNGQLLRQYIKSKSLPTTTELKQHLIALWLHATATGTTTISPSLNASNATNTALHGIENAVTSHASIGVANEIVVKSSVLTTSSSSLLSLTALLNSSLLPSFLTVKVEPEPGPELIQPTPLTFELPAASIEPSQDQVTQAVESKVDDSSALIIDTENVVAGTAEAEEDDDVATTLSSHITSASSYFYTSSLPPHTDPPTQEPHVTVNDVEVAALVPPAPSAVKNEATADSDRVTLPVVEHLSREAVKEVVFENGEEEEEEDYVLINKSEFDNTSDDETVNPNIHSTLSPPPPIRDIHRGSWLSSTQLVTYIIDRKLFPGTRAK